MRDFREKTIDQIMACGVVAILRFDDPPKIPTVVESILEGGLSVVEIPMNTPKAEEMIASLSFAYGKKLCLGAGTVLDLDTASRAISAGAAYLVSPIVKKEIIRYAHENGAAAIPGCLTPTEILQAHEAGADLIKLFPAGVLGPGYIRSLLGPMPFLRLMPTGGIKPDEVGAWIRAGATCVGMGNALVGSHEAPEARARIIERVRKIRQEIEKARAIP